MQIIQTQQITIDYAHQPRMQGSNARKINMDVNGKPFGQLWTFKASGETHPWHAKPINGEHRAFYEADGGLKAAKEYMEREALAA